MVAYLEKHKILYVRQYGFRKKHSTNDAATNVIAEILQSFDANQMVLAIFVDLRKAFDTVSHSIIIKKLSALGVGDVELDWFRNYLNNRMQCVTINKSVSPLREVNTGVPQDSLLGVLLFQLTVNDMHKCLRFSKSVLYADDTTIPLSGNSV